MSCFVAPCSVISVEKVKSEFYAAVENLKADDNSVFSENTKQLSLCKLLNLMSSVVECTKPPDDFSGIISYTERNFDKKITLDFLAEKFYMSKFTLSRHFSKYTGTSLPKYLNTIRIINAKKYLDSGLGVTETAMVCGFESTSSFDRVFQTLAGMSPSKYKLQKNTK